LSVFDFAPFRRGSDGLGIPENSSTFCFGGDGSGVGINLTEPKQFLKILLDLGIRLVCTTAGSPYYNPHIQRPALFPPSDGYEPPEDPLVGVARQIWATAELKRSFPELIFVGSGLSYLQDWFPNVAEALVADGLMDCVGLGRMALSYPNWPADILSGRPADRKRICRTFSDCTTAPRNGLVSGCYPLDTFYKNHLHAKTLADIKSKS
jgi:2,4-dienoyl-CoA reductase-like NADH-dependent reductase (Old Yellow Enzyme family)